jgi:leucyl/phenylalanyl-tRNA--protein transferase
MSHVDEDGTQHPEAPLDLVRVSPPEEPLSPFLVMFFYARGVFPWLQEKNRRLWWSPEPRAVVFTDELRINRSLRKVLRRGRYRVTADTAFERVIRACRDTRSGGHGPGSWITEEIIDVFLLLHRLGHAHSVETWEGDQLVGGLYGLCVGQVFYGCSMFRTAPDASKVALVRLVEQLREWEFPLLDCQIHNPHLKSMGARLITRDEFHKVVNVLVRGKRRVGSWTKIFT